MDEQQPTKKEQERQAANEVGQIAGRTVANAYTGGTYEKIRNTPVVGGVARHGERTIGKAVSAADRLTGGRIGKVGNKIKKALPNRSAKPTGKESAGTENNNNADNNTGGTQNSNQQKGGLASKGLPGIGSVLGISSLKGKGERDLKGEIIQKLKKIVIRKAIIFALPVVLIMLFVTFMIAALDDNGKNGLTMAGY